MKYNSSGVKQWTRLVGDSIQNNTNEYGYDITIDSSDNIFITGATFGGIDGNTNAGSLDAIVIKYNSTGVKQ